MAKWTFYLLALLLLPFLQSSERGVKGFADSFTGNTLRVDYYHSGDTIHEEISLDVVRLEGPWPGSRSRLLDDLNLGKFLFQVVDLRAHQTIYSKGFASIFGEWQTTGDARRRRQTFHESQRFPEPRFRVQLVLKKRGDDGAFREIWTEVVDPQGRFVDRSPIPKVGRIQTLRESGPPSQKVDLLLLGDGYGEHDADKWERDSRKAVDALFGYEPFLSHTNDFNVRTLQVDSPSSGITDPRAGQWIRSPFGLSYNAFDSERYILTYANRQLREYAAQVPYDALILIGNSRKYGGGGIYNLWCTSAADSAENGYLVVHEFGHSFAGLGDEYYTSQVSYEEFNPPGVEPWEPNITAVLERALLKWGDLVSSGTPLPTPWNQSDFDAYMISSQEKRQAMRARGASEEEMEAYFTDVRAHTAPLMAAERYAAAVGAFQGAAYQAQGLYRPEVDCIMFTRNPYHFCRVCTRALERVIESYLN